MLSILSCPVLKRVECIFFSSLVACFNIKRTHKCLCVRSFCCGFFAFHCTRPFFCFICIFAALSLVFLASCEVFNCKNASVNRDNGADGIWCRFDTFRLLSSEFWVMESLWGPTCKKKKTHFWQGWGGGYREYKYAPLFETNSLVFSLGTRTSEQLSWWNSGR